MAHVTISLSVEAYDALKKIKQEKESFSDEVLRLIAPKKSKLRDIFGILSKEEAEELENNVNDLRKRAKVRPWR